MSASIDKDELLRQISLWAAFSMPMTSEQIRSLADYLEPTISVQITTLLDDLEQSIKQHTVPEGSHLVTRSYVLNAIKFAKYRTGAIIMEDEEPREILNTATWGDYQKEDGTWARGISNATELAETIQAHYEAKIVEARIDELEKLSWHKDHPPEFSGHDTGSISMVENLGKIKSDVFNKFKEKGIDDTQIMLDIIQKATGKQTIDNADDAMSVLAELEK